MKNKPHYSILSDKDPSVTERLIRTLRNLPIVKETIIEKGNADWKTDQKVQKFDSQLNYKDPNSSFFEEERKTSIF